MANISVAKILNAVDTGYKDTINIMIKLNTLTVIVDNTENKEGEYNEQDIT